jgi:tRNA dimethylallyltransferase
VDKKPVIITIVGPTASGKSALALALARRYGRPIISADSRQVYRHMAIGTNQPTVAELNAVPHFLTGHIEPTAPYNAARFTREALAVIEQLQAAGVQPIVVGGTGLYLQALERGFDHMPDVPPAVRAQVEADYSTHGLAPLVTELQQADPAAADAMDLKNPARVKRAVEVIRATGRPFSSFKQGFVQDGARPFTLLKIGLDVPRAELYDRINRRVLHMMDQGLLHEVRTLLDKGFSPTLNALQTIGYREMIAHLQGELTLARAIELLQQNTRNYAKRQLTWFRRDDAICWFAPQQEAQIIAYIEAQNKP